MPDESSPRFEDNQGHAVLRMDEDALNRSVAAVCGCVGQLAARCHKLTTLSAFVDKSSFGFLAISPMALARRRSRGVALDIRQGLASRLIMTSNIPNNP